MSKRRYRAPLHPSPLTAEIIGTAYAQICREVAEGLEQESRFKSSPPEGFAWYKNPAYETAPYEYDHETRILKKR